jgi:hypothetical protein
MVSHKLPPDMIGEACAAEFPDGSDSRFVSSRRAFLGTATGMAAVLLVVNQVYGRIFAVHKAKAAASGETVIDAATSDLACFAAEHWNPLMLEEFCQAHRRFKQS